MRDVYTVTDELAGRFDAVNLGRGVPDFGGPSPLHAAAARAVRDGPHQYVASEGTRELRAALAEHYAGAYDPDTEITVTAGATEALRCALASVLAPGDGVLIPEPCYDAYPPLVRSCGGRPVPVPLRREGDRYVLDPADLPVAGARALLLNAPHNPTGWMPGEAELAALAEFAVRHDLVVVADEVYEQLWYGEPHRSVATLPGMRERTIVCSSASKTLSVCGWRVGWALAPARLTAALRDVHRFTTFCAPAPLQAAVAAGLRWAGETGWFAAQRAEYAVRRGLLLDALEAAGWSPARPAGAFFVLARTPVTGDDPFEANDRLVRSRGVAGLPMTTFHSRPERAAGLLRFAFCKRLPVMEDAHRRLTGSLVKGDV
ncbi:pyridoxal phosphate-dependent aminotransferase [Microbispora sp. H11081]|uniref:pyridoxal phosphate-dependent aminotransferase n=1 Tax=Microbispora sp. H11081 TaxID=2729107 RepID=UPI001473C46F|nr:aminotransferase class I/II-fold pyridoxal phosphate-dependent enzyme [Microbispora sp. H11081]